MPIIEGAASPLPPRFTGTYYLVSFDPRGNEVPDPSLTVPGQKRPRLLLSDWLVHTLRHPPGDPFTDVFVVSHGWLADYDGALSSYAAWLGSIQAASNRPPTGPAFTPLIVALHWPSRPNTLGDRHAQDPIPVPFQSRAGDNLSGDEPSKVHDPAEGARPGLLDALSAILPFLSFYRMKQRAEKIGRSGGAALVAKLQQAAPAARVHLVGHSFGAKLVAEAVGDHDGRGVAPVHSLFLIEAAFSTWSFAPDAGPYGVGPGGLRSVLDPAHPRVTGTVVAGTSKFDYALSRAFPGAELIDLVLTKLRQLRLPFARLNLPPAAPRLGALGVFGFAGYPAVPVFPAPAAADPAEAVSAVASDPSAVTDAVGASSAAVAADAPHDDVVVRRVRLLAANEGGTLGVYPFEAAHVYQLIGDDVVNDQSSVSILGRPVSNSRPLQGAHNNIAHPEVARAFWQAVLAGTPLAPVVEAPPA